MKTINISSIIILLLYLFNLFYYKRRSTLLASIRYGKLKIVYSWLWYILEDKAVSIVDTVRDLV